MAYTLLQATNKVLKRVSLIQGSSGELSSLTDSARQTDVDIVVSSWNDVIDELYKAGKLPGEMDTGTFTLSTSGTDSGREYAVDADFVAMAGNPIDTTNARTLTPYPGGYFRMREDLQDPSDSEGKPSHWVISPVSGNIRIDTTPQTADNGDIFTYVFEKTRNLSLAADTFPFGDDAVDALVDAVSQVWRLHRKGKTEFIDTLYQSSMTRAMRMVRGEQPSETYGVHKGGSLESWPI